MNQLHLKLDQWGRSSEKGSQEWSAFNAVRDERVGMFRVATPIPQQPRYTNIVPIKRYHSTQQLFPRAAH
jgi:hypothetical protein